MDRLNEIDDEAKSSRCSAINCGFKIRNVNAINRIGMHHIIPGMHRIGVRDGMEHATFTLKAGNQNLMFEHEIRYEEISKQRIAEGNYFTGFFTALYQKN